MELFCSPHYELYSFPEDVQYSKANNTKIFLGNELSKSSIQDTILEYYSMFEGAKVDTFKYDKSVLIANKCFANCKNGDTIIAVNIYGYIVASYGSFSYRPTSQEQRIYYISNDNRLLTNLDALWYYERDELLYKSSLLTPESLYLKYYNELLSADVISIENINNLHAYTQYTGLGRFMFFNDSNFRMYYIHKYFSAVWTWFVVIGMASVLIYLLKFRRTAIFILFTGLLVVFALGFMQLSDRRYKENVENKRVEYGLKYSNETRNFSELESQYDVSIEMINNYAVVDVTGGRLNDDTVRVGIDTNAFKNGLNKYSFLSIFEKTVSQIRQNKYLLDWKNCSNKRRFYMSFGLDSLGSIESEEYSYIERVKNIGNVEVSLRGEPNTIKVSYYPTLGFGLVTSIYSDEGITINKCSEIDFLSFRYNEVAFISNDTVLIIKKKIINKKRPNKQ